MTKITKLYENLDVVGSLAIKNGGQVAGYVLVSDSGGTGSWVSPSTLTGITGGSSGTPITTNVIPKGTGTGITDGTWAFSGNTLYPLTDLSNIGLSGTNRIDTIYLASNLDYANHLIFKEAGVEKARFIAGGNFGIGTTAATTPLQVVGTVTLSGFDINTINGLFTQDNELTVHGAGPMHFNDNSKGISMANRTVYATSNLFRLGKSYQNIVNGSLFQVFGISADNTTNSAEFRNFNETYLMHISNAGNVAIGLTAGTAPTARLQVRGEGTASTYALKVENSAGTSTLSVRNDGVTTVGDALSSLSNVFNVTTSAGILLSKYTSDISSQIKLEGLSNSSYYLTNGYNGTWFELMGSSLNPLLQVATNGNVGIGNDVTTPTSRLGIKGDGSTNPLLTITNTGSTALYVGYDGKIGINDSSPLAMLSISATTSNYTDTALEIKNSSNRELFHVSNRGEVGIGITPASGLATLYINSQEVGLNILGIKKQNGQVTETISSDGTHIFYSGGVGSSVFTSDGDWGFGISPTTSAKVHIIGRPTVNPLLVQTDTLMNGLVVNTSGNVGIGTQNPTSKLLVSGATTTTGHSLTVNNSTGFTSFNIKDDGVIGVGYVGTGDTKVSIKGTNTLTSDYGLRVHDSTGINNSFVVRNDTRVGVGTASPNSQLDVVYYGSHSSLGLQNFYNLGNTSISLVNDTSSLGLSMGVYNSGSGEVDKGFISMGHGKNFVHLIGTSPVGTWRVQSTSYTSPELFVDGNGVGVNTTGTTTAKFTIKGTSTGSTYSLNVKNSGETSVFAVRDDGFIRAGDVTNQNLSIGLDSGWVPQSQNVFLGYKAGFSVTTGYQSVAVGAYALNAITDGTRNIGVGYSAGSGLVSGDQNIAMGHATLGGDASDCVNIGFYSARVLSGSANVGVGSTHMILATTTEHNIAIGVNTLNALTNETGGNVAIGSAAGQSVTGSKNIFLGYAAGRTQVAASNKLLIGNQLYGNSEAEITGSIVHGVMDAVAANQTLTFNASVGVNTTGTTASSLLVKGLGSGTSYTAKFNNINGNSNSLVVRDDVNVGFGTDTQFGSGSGVIGIANAIINPSVAPTGGGILFVSGGTLNFMGSAGTITQIAIA